MMGGRERASARPRSCRAGGGRYPLARRAAAHWRRPKTAKPTPSCLSLGPGCDGDTWTRAPTGPARPVSNTLRSRPKFAGRLSRMRRALPIATLLLPILAIAVQVVLEALRPPPERFSDLQVYVGATKELVRGGSLYDYVRGQGEIFTYPPLAGYLLCWLAVLPRGLGEALWCLLTAGSIALIAFSLQMARRRPGEAQGKSVAAMGILAFLLAVSSPGRSNLMIGQVSVVVVALAAADVFLLSGRWRGSLLGLAIAMKLTPLLFVPLLVLAGRRRQAGVALLAAACLTLLSALPNVGQSRRYWTHVIISGDTFVDPWIAGNQSIKAVLERAGVTSATIWIACCLIVVVIALTVGGVLMRFGEELLGVSCVGACSVLVSPISWTHHQFWLLAPSLCAVRNYPVPFRLWCACSLGLMFVGPIGDPPVSGPLGWIITNVHMVVAFSVIVSCAVLLLRSYLLSGAETPRDPPRLETAGAGPDPRCP